MNTWSRFSEENERIWRHEKTHFSEFAVFSAFCTKNGVVTKTGDIGKTFSWLENLAVLQGFWTQIRKLMSVEEVREFCV